MQNKGFVKVVAVLLTIICAFYLSFSFVTNKYDNEAKEYAQGDPAKEKAYLDSLNNEVVWVGKTYQECREMEIGLGLDLQGGLSVIVEVSVPDVVKALAGNTKDEAFNKALENANKRAGDDGSKFMDYFVEEFRNGVKERSLADFFATDRLSGRVSKSSSDSEIIEVINEEIENAVENSEVVLRTRIDRFGVAQPNIQRLEGSLGRIMIELPGAKDPERILKLLQGSAQLEFWSVYSSEEALAIISKIDRKLNSNEFSSKLHVEKIGGSIAGIVSNSDRPAVEKIIASIEDEFSSEVHFAWNVKPTDNKEHILYALRVDRRTESGAALAGDVITDARDEFDEFNKPCVSMTMNSRGAHAWSVLTGEESRRANGCVAVVLDNEVYSAASVNEAITGGRTRITGNFTVNETKDLVNVLRSGKMPAPVRVISHEIVGPSLGQESIEMGIISCLVAFVLLMIYMCAMYGLIPGFVANLALLANLFFTLGILASFQASLTLAGIAGMVLTLGMAVDANVLIYERTKEELRAGKTVAAALGDGYKNAFSAIFDANFTSIITGIILFNFGTGPIRGFATTLIIGILCSFFTAVFLTRIIFEHFLNKGKWRNLTFTTAISKNLMANTNYNFIGSRVKSYIVFAVVGIVMAVSIGIRGLSQSIDFTGGRNYVVTFEQEVQPEAVRVLLREKMPESNVQVIALGTDGKTLRISTNYCIDKTTEDVEGEIVELIYTSLKEEKLLSEDVTLEAFSNYSEESGDASEEVKKVGLNSSQKVGPSMAEDIREGAVISVILALVAIFIYILIRFRNVAYSVGSIVALSVDVLLIIGMYSLCYGWLPMSLDIDQTFVGAILTAIGYSINDKVVIFDRIREFDKLYPNRDKISVFNGSLNTTLARTINTSVSTLVVLLCIFILGGDAVRSFSFAMILGVVFGTLSSLFLAAPIAYSVMGKRAAKEAKKSK